jgi:hypothetical protein
LCFRVGFSNFLFLSMVLYLHPVLRMVTKHVLSLRKIEAAYDVLTRHMDGLIQGHRVDCTTKSSVKYDVFSLLLDAREAEGKLSMTDGEIASDSMFSTLLLTDRARRRWGTRFLFCGLAMV